MTTTTAMTIDNQRHSLLKDNEWHFETNMIAKKSKRDREALAENLLVLFMELAPTNGECSQPISHTMFTITVGGKVFVITAGHVLEFIKKIIDSGRLRSSYFVDRFNVRDTIVEKDKVPVDIANCINQSLIHDADGVDVAVIQLSDYYANLIRAGGHVPATPAEIHVSNLDKLHAEFVVGLPSEPQRSFVESGKVKHSGAIVILELYPVSDESLINKMALPRIARTVRPEDVKFDDGTVLSKLNGMSGGPVIAVRYSENDEIVQKWVVGIQSSWDVSSRIMYATYLSPLVKWIEEQMAKTSETVPSSEAAD